MNPNAIQFDGSYSSTVSPFKPSSGFIIHAAEVLVNGVDGVTSLETAGGSIGLIVDGETEEVTGGSNWKLDRSGEGPRNV